MESVITLSNKSLESASLGSELHDPDRSEEKMHAHTVHPFSSTKEFNPGSTTSTTPVTSTSIRKRVMLSTVSIPKSKINSEQSSTDRGTVVNQATNRISSHSSLQEVKSQITTNEPENSIILRILGRTAERRLFPSSSDIFMSVKSSSLTSSRLPILLLTWMQTVLPKQVKCCKIVSGIHKLMYGNLV